MGQPFTIESLMTIAAGGDLLIGAAEEAVSRFESFPAMSEWGWSNGHSVCSKPSTPESLEMLTVAVGSMSGLAWTSCWPTMMRYAVRSMVTEV